LPIGKRNQPTDALTGFENSNEIHMIFEYGTLLKNFKKNTILKGQLKNANQHLLAVGTNSGLSNHFTFRPF